MKSAVALNYAVAIQDWADTVAVTLNGEHVLSFTNTTTAQLDVNKVALYIAEAAVWLQRRKVINKLPAPQALRMEARV